MGKGIGRKDSGEVNVWKFLQFFDISSFFEALVYWLTYGVMEYWSIVKENVLWPNTPSFQYSIIPIAEQSEAKLKS
jgi:hypothetical protein